MRNAFGMKSRRNTWARVADKSDLVALPPQGKGRRVFAAAGQLPRDTEEQNRLFKKRLLMSHTRKHASPCAGVCRVLGAGRSPRLNKAYGVERPLGTMGEWGCSPWDPSAGRGSGMRPGQAQVGPSKARCAQGPARL